MIHISKSAADEIRRLQSWQRQLDARVRLGVQAGGCADFYYTVGFDEAVHSSDMVYDCSGIPVVVDVESLNYITGLTIDYSEDLMGGGFRYHNPNAASCCGCGNSFSLEKSTDRDTSCPKN